MRKKMRNMIFMSLIACVMFVVSPNATVINATSDQTDYQLTILPGESLPDESVPEAEIKENDPMFNKEKRPLPQTGFPADLYAVNIGIILILIGVLLNINSQERNDRYEIL